MASRRLVQLFLGLGLYGVSLALMVRADLGLDPWDVFHQGVAGRTGLLTGGIELNALATAAYIARDWDPAPVTGS